MSDIVLITPPFTQLNTPYPATPHLKGFLNSIHQKAFQIDLGIEVILQLFSQKGLTDIFNFAQQNHRIKTDNGQRIYALREHYINTIDNVIIFLQGQNATLSRQISAGGFLPQASRFQQIENTQWAFGSMGLLDKAKYMATLYLEDLSDFIVECIDGHFGFSRYAERLGRSANSFDELYTELQQERSYIDDVTLLLLDEKLKKLQPKLVCFSVPFPGNLFSALRCAQFIKQKYPAIKTAMGGGFANTELRSLSDARVFEFFDFITLDDGEQPLELLASSLLNKQEADMQLKRTFVLQNGKVEFVDNSPLPDYKQRELCTPDYSDLMLSKYISVIELPNPMHTLWSDGRWNKLYMAHGCYWGKCTFCDGTLPYIGYFDPMPAMLLANRMEQIIQQTGETGFHFVDEAAPPALMIALAEEIILRKLIVTWWTNVRFEKHFTPDVCILLKASGCIAVSGGLEVASDRLLKLINKGVSVEQVAKVTRNFTQAGIMVHAYLMYGFPSQTVQETVDSLEMVRQLFDQGLIQSGFWHQFALTAHSPVGQQPQKYGITTLPAPISFANNDVQFTDSTGIDHARFSFGLKKSLFNFMHGSCFDHPLQNWFDFKIPKTMVPRDYISNCLDAPDTFDIKPTARILWMGGQAITKRVTKTKKGQTFENMQLQFHFKNNSVELMLDVEQGQWLVTMLAKLSVKNGEHISWQMLKTDFEQHFENFELFWFSKQFSMLRKNGLLCL
jgi:hypothetical protein